MTGNALRQPLDEATVVLEQIQIIAATVSRTSASTSGNSLGSAK
eukprot:CAMPEP_0171817982 /NCGR_PEP_ID=MMETSP0992-20121227/1402_1 /TAXON_ID=483369 /ORGANISM="non described non described, Strain CCMP2098" /LENGTH=43 /DNA_ID= /DNA_START= /DNA_END= /DNA_ORIENTATION=